MIPQPTSSSDDAIRAQVRDTYGAAALASTESPGLYPLAAQLYGQTCTADGGGGGGVLGLREPDRAGRPAIWARRAGRGLRWRPGRAVVRAPGRPPRAAIGVDMTPEMMALAQRHAAEAGLSNVEPRLGSIEDLPVEDACVDVVISNCVVNLSPATDGDHGWRRRSSEV